MARPRASDRADYGLVWLMPIARYHEGRITDTQLCDVIKRYGDALAACRAGDFDSEEIPPPDIMALDEDGWRRHIEKFVDGIRATDIKRQKARAAYAETRVSASETRVSASETRVSASETPQNKEKDEAKEKEKKDEGERKAREGATPLADTLSTLQFPFPSSDADADTPQTIGRELTPLSGEEFCKQRELCKANPVIFAMVVCRLPMSDADNRRAFGAQFKRLGKEEFLKGVEEAWQEGAKQGKSPSPALMQKTLADRRGEVPRVKLFGIH